MRKVLLALSGAAVALTTAAAAAPVTGFTCTKWRDGVCVSTHRVKGRPAYAVGYVFGPNYAYTTVGGLPQPVVTYDNLTASNRYVYSNGYIYVVDPTTYAVERVITAITH